jgi:hypothetical protein
MVWPARQTKLVQGLLCFLAKASTRLSLIDANADLDVILVPLCARESIFRDSIVALEFADRRIGNPEREVANWWIRGRIGHGSTEHGGSPPAFGSPDE